jgi:hypothetical protein
MTLSSLELIQVSESCIEENKTDLVTLTDISSFKRILMDDEEERRRDLLELAHDFDMKSNIKKLLAFENHSVSECWQGC